MNLARAKEYYKLGTLTEFTAVPCRDDDDKTEGWMLVMQGTSPTGEVCSWTLETALHRPKIYATLQSLSADAMRTMGETARQPWTMKL